MCGECNLFDVTLALGTCMMCDVMSCRKRIILCSTNTEELLRSSTCDIQVIVSFSTYANLGSLQLLLLEVSLLSVWNWVCVCTTLQCDMETWPRSAMWSLWIFSVLFVIRFLCDSMIMSSWYCCEHEESSFCFHRRPYYLHKVAFQLEPFGLAGVAFLQGIAEALRISNFLLALFTISSE